MELVEHLLIGSTSVPQSLIIVASPSSLVIALADPYRSWSGSAHLDVASQESIVVLPMLPMVGFISNLNSLQQGGCHEQHQAAALQGCTRRTPGLGVLRQVFAGG